MAYQFTDTFDHYTTPSSKYEATNGSLVISGAYARFPAVGSFPNQGLTLPSNAYVRKNLKSNQATLIAFLSYGAASLPSSGYNDIASFLDNGTYKIRLCVSAAGALQFVNHAGAAIGPASANGLIAPSPTSKPNHGIEFKVAIGSSGSVLCYLDGALVIALTSGLDTQGGGNAYGNQVHLGSTGVGASAFYTDYLRVWDNTGSYQNAPVGYDVRKLTKLAAGAGDLTQWTANGAAANWQCVDDASPDEDTTYVSSAGTNYDSYAMGTSGFSGVPSQVVVISRVRKDDGATRTLQIGVRSGSSNGLGAPVTLGSSYAWIDECISLDPATGSPPTAAAADAFQHLKYEAS